MTQITYAVNLTSADFTFSFNQKGRSVVVPQSDQNAMLTRNFSGNAIQYGINIPQILYCENVVPTSYGYKSVAYELALYPITLANSGDMLKVFTIHDGRGNSALVGVTESRRLFISSSYTLGEWVFAGGPGNNWYEVTTPSDEISVAMVMGRIFLYVGGANAMREIDIPTSSINWVSLTGVALATVNGIVASNSYLILWDDTTVYWSSATDPTDFTPSLISGAGSAIPEALKGKIVHCKELAEGYAIYTTGGIIGAIYSSNTTHPWVWRILSGSAAVRSADAVATDLSRSTHFAWTSSGLMEVTAKAAVARFPEITDFIAQAVEEETADSVSSFPSSSPRARDEPEVRLAYLSNRYLIISIGRLRLAASRHLSVANFSKAFVYDAQLARWGNLTVDHTQVFELVNVYVPPTGSWLDAVGNLQLHLDASRPETLAEDSWGQVQSWKDLSVYNNTTTKPTDIYGPDQVPGGVRFNVDYYVNP